MSRLNRYPDGGGGAAARGARRAPRRAARAGGARQRRRRADPPLRRRHARPRRRRGLPVAVVPELPGRRPRCSGAEPLAGAAGGPRGRPRRAAGARRGAPGTKLVYLANPNNPTGALLEAADVRGFLDAAARSVLCVLDEAYAEYADPEPEGRRSCARARPRLCVLRTFSKVYGLAALRVGYALASPEVADALDRVRPIFNVNQPAQEAALASLRRGARPWRCRIGHAAGPASALYETLAGGRARPEPSQANFVYADVPGGDGAALARRLLEEEGILVRELPGFGAPGGIRVTVGTDEENEAFAAALGRVLTRSDGRAVPPV